MKKKKNHPVIKNQPRIYPKVNLQAGNLPTYIYIYIYILDRVAQFLSLPYKMESIILKNLVSNPSLKCKNLARVSPTIRKQKKFTDVDMMALATSIHSLTNSVTNTLKTAQPKVGFEEDAVRINPTTTN